MPKTIICKHCKEVIARFEFHDCCIPFPDDIRRKLEQLWFVYGNNGPKHHQQDHYYVQRLVEGRRAEADRCIPTRACKEAVKKVLESDESS